jgi:hypothetical protein
MKNIILSICLIFLFVSISLAQEYKWKEGNSYDNAKVYLVSGEVIKTKSISVLSSEIKVFSKTLLEPKNYSLDNVNRVEVPTKNNILLGALVGTAAGVGVMLLVESNYEKPETSHESGAGWSSTTTVTKEMPDIEKIPIVLGGTALGAWIGSTIKSGWKKIYPNDNLSFNFSFQRNRSIHPVFSFTLNF